MSGRFNPLYRSTNQKLFEKYLCNQSSKYEKYGWFLLYKGGQWQIHEECIGIPKGTSRAEVTSNSDACTLQQNLL